MDLALDLSLLHIKQSLQLTRITRPLHSPRSNSPRSNSPRPNTPRPNTPRPNTPRPNTPVSPDSLGNPDSFRTPISPCSSNQETPPNTPSTPSITPRTPHFIIDGIIISPDFECSRSSSNSSNDSGSFLLTPKRAKNPDNPKDTKRFKADDEGCYITLDEQILELNPSPCNILFCPCCQGKYSICKVENHNCICYLWHPSVCKANQLEHICICNKNPFIRNPYCRYIIHSLEPVKNTCSCVYDGIPKKCTAEEHTCICKFYKDCLAENHKCACDYDNVTKIHHDWCKTNDEHRCICLQTDTKLCKSNLHYCSCCPEVCKYDNSSKCKSNGTHWCLCKKEKHLTIATKLKHKIHKKKKN